MIIDTIYYGKDTKGIRINNVYNNRIKEIKKSQNSKNTYNGKRVKYYSSVKYYKRKDRPIKRLNDKLSVLQLWRINEGKKVCEHISI